MKYNHLEIETKWQEFWYKEDSFSTDVDLEKEKIYILDMFP